MLLQNLIRDQKRLYFTDVYQSHYRSHGIYRSLGLKWSTVIKISQNKLNIISFKLKITWR